MPEIPLNLVLKINFLNIIKGAGPLHQIEDSLLVLKIGSCEHTTNDLPIFSPQKRNLEMGPSERPLPIFGTKNWILKIGSCERALT